MAVCTHFFANPKMTSGEIVAFWISIICWISFSWKVTNSQFCFVIIKFHNFLCTRSKFLIFDAKFVKWTHFFSFMKDPESRKRNLHIRTYTVIPLNETNGIIEWVNNLQPFRIILTKLYKARPGFKMIKAEEQKNFVTIANDFEGKIFTNYLSTWSISLWSMKPLYDF